MAESILSAAFFHNETEAYKFVEARLWPHGATCPKCGVIGRPPVAKIVNRLKAFPARLWLWKNFVDGRPEYWAFDNPYPCHPNGDPITLGEPCGYADFKDSEQGRFDVSEAEVIEAIKRAAKNAPSLDAIREVLRLTDRDHKVWKRANEELAALETLSAIRERK